MAFPSARPSWTWGSGAASSPRRPVFSLQGGPGWGCEDSGAQGCASPRGAALGPELLPRALPRALCLLLRLSHSGRSGPGSRGCERSCRNVCWMVLPSGSRSWDTQLSLSFPSRSLPWSTAASCQTGAPGTCTCACHSAPRSPHPARDRHGRASAGPERSESPRLRRLLGNFADAPENQRKSSRRVSQAPGRARVGTAPGETRRKDRHRGGEKLHTAATHYRAAGTDRREELETTLTVQGETRGHPGARTSSEDKGTGAPGRGQGAGRGQTAVRTHTHVLVHIGERAWQRGRRGAHTCIVPGTGRPCGRGLRQDSGGGVRGLGH